MIKIGDKLPQSRFLKRENGQIGPVELSEFSVGNRIVMFGLPGPFTDTCSIAHLPSFIRTADAFRTKGVTAIICYAVADPFIMEAWGEATGATAAGIEMLADADGSFTKALGLNFDAPVVGFYGRTTRNAMIVTDGVVEALQLEEKRGICEATAGETLLEML